MVERALDSGKVVFLTETEVKRIFGDKFVKGITVLKKGKERNFAVAGVFIEIGSLPASGFVEDVERDRTGEIVVNCKCETNIPGIFAAGDVTTVPAKQIIVACGEGAKAILSAFEYLSKL